MNEHKQIAEDMVIAKLAGGTLDQAFDVLLGRARAILEDTGEIPSVFVCVTNDGIFQVPASWKGLHEKAEAYRALRNCFRRRGVKRYFFAGEAWANAGKPDAFEIVLVIAVERGSAH